MGWHRDWIYKTPAWWDPHPRSFGRELGLHSPRNTKSAEWNRAMWRLDIVIVLLCDFTFIEIYYNEQALSPYVVRNFFWKNSFKLWNFIWCFSLYVFIRHFSHLSPSILCVFLFSFYLYSLVSSLLPLPLPSILSPSLLYLWTPWKNKAISLMALKWTIQPPYHSIIVI